MTNRVQRQTILVDETSYRIRGLRKDPCLTGFLDEFDRADAEGLNQMVEALLSEVGRSGHLSGFGLELAIANLAMDVPAPRSVRCEQTEGLCKAPGDVWLDKSGVRFEFQCKHSLNWTVELMVADAIDKIVAATENDSPGFLFDLKPGVTGDKADWTAFANWVIQNYKGFAVGTPQAFSSSGSHIASFSLLSQYAAPGLRVGTQMSPGGVQTMDIDLLRKKLRDGFKAAKRSISALASPTQMNCLVVDFDNFMVETEDIFIALYGDVVYDLQGEALVPRFEASGLYYTESLDLWSAVVSARIRECNPLQATAAIFPNPKWFNEAKAAFSGFPRSKFIASTQDAGL